MVCGTDGGFLVLVWYVVMMVDVWCLVLVCGTCVVCGDFDGFMVRLCFLVMILGL